MWNTYRNRLQLLVPKSVVLKVVPLALRLLSEDWKRKKSSEIAQGLKFQQKKGKGGRRKKGREIKSLCEVRKSANSRPHKDRKGGSNI